MIIVEHLSKYYGPRAAIDDLTFAIARGEVVGLLGRNGAGKTTTLNILSGLLAPTAGRVRIDGIDLREDPEAVLARTGFLPDTPPLYGEMTIGEYLTFVLHIKGVRQHVAEKVAKALAATDLSDMRHARIDTLSQGYKRRVGIAQAIVHEPALVLLDEPASSLDPAQVVHMRDLIRSLAKKHTVLVSSHLLAEIEKTCDRLLLLHEGRVVAEGTEEKLSERVRTSTEVALVVRGARATLARALTSLPFVERHEVESEHDGVLRAKLELREDAREELARALLASDLGLLHFERVRVPLEDIFLSLTRPSSSEVGAA